MTGDDDGLAAPLRVSLLDSRVSLIDADGRKLCEIDPGQILGVVPTLEERLKIAHAIVERCNHIEQFGWNA